MPDSNHRRPWRPFRRTGTAERLAEIGRPVDILVDNAGTIYREPAGAHDVEQWDRVLEVNLTSQFLLAQALGPQMVTRGYGKVIFTASMLSFQGGINVASYTASKQGSPV